MQRRSHLFIAGTPRSGTTAITKMLSHHPNVALCMERFKFIYKHDVLVPGDFAIARIREFPPTETNLSATTPEHAAHYARVLPKWPRAAVIGDKCPTLYKKYLYLSRTFAGTVKFLFVARDVQSICSSWNARALDDADPWPRTNDFAQAIHYWNDANRRTIAALDGGIPILVINYDALFDRRLGLGHSTLQSVLEHIAQPDDAQLTAAWQAYCDDFEHIARTRKYIVLPGQNEAIAQQVNCEMYRRVMKHAIGGESLGRVGSNYAGLQVRV